MKTRTVVVLAVTLVMSSFGVGLCSDPDAVYDLTGEWDTVITVRGLGSGTATVIKDVVKMSQNGNTFLGVRTIGSKFISKNDEWIKGRIANGIVEEVFMQVTDDMSTLSLMWDDGRAAIAADGNTIFTQTFNASTNLLVSATLTRK